MLPDYVKERPFLVVTNRGTRTIQARVARNAIMDWAKGTRIRAGQKKITKVADNYWFCILIDEDDKPFDCWAIDLEPEKKKAPAEKPAV